MKGVDKLINEFDRNVAYNSFKKLVDQMVKGGFDEQEINCLIDGMETNIDGVDFSILYKLWTKKIIKEI